MDSNSPAEVDQEEDRRFKDEEMKKKEKGKAPDEQEVQEGKIDLEEVAEDIKKVQQKTDDAEEEKKVQQKIDDAEEEIKKAQQMIDAADPSVYLRRLEEKTTLQEKENLLHKKRLLQASSSSGEERSSKKLKIDFAASAAESFRVLKPKFSALFDRFRALDRKLRTTEKGVPFNQFGNPSILLHNLTDGWTRTSSNLWCYVNHPSDRVVPVVGVSGCGKTRFLYEVLASQWGFYFTGTTAGNGGSRDIEFLQNNVQFHLENEDKKANYFLAQVYMMCAILSRLMILELFIQDPDLTPLEWLMLQVEYRVFLPPGEKEFDPYSDLTSSLVEGLRPAGWKINVWALNTEVERLWLSIQGSLRKSGRLTHPLTLVLDDAQVLGSFCKDSFVSPGSNESRAILSPFFAALVRPSTGKNFEHQVFISGTRITYADMKEELLMACAINFYALVD